MPFPILLSLLSMPALATDSLSAADPAALGEGENGALDAPELIAQDPGPHPIINGTSATEADYPMTGGMLMDAHLDLGSYGEYDLRMFVCSSTLIAPDVVLLASHCLDEVSFTQGLRGASLEINEIRWTRQADLSALDGSSRRTPDWPEDSVVAADWTEHPDFDLLSMSLPLAENNDVALLFLSEPVLDVPFAYLPTEAESDQIEEGALVNVVGWGQTVATDAMEQPPEGTYAYKQMGESVIGALNDYEFQVGPEEDDVRKCHGDSGGPTFMDIDTDSSEKMRIIGVTSHSYDRTDCDSKGGVDTRLMHYRDWIDAELTQRCEDGSRAWCDELGLPTPPIPEPDPIDAGDDTGGGSGGEEEGGKGGCACSSGPTPASPWSLGLLGLLSALALRRRRG